MPCNGSTLAANTKTEKLPTSSGAAQNLTAATEEEEEEEREEEAHCLSRDGAYLNSFGSQRNKSQSPVIICDFHMRYEPSNVNDSGSSL